MLDMSPYPNLALIANYGAGLENIDLEAAAARGICVTHTPDLLTEDVADLAITLTLALLRQVVSADRFVRSGQWGTAPFPLGRSPRGMKLGIFGFGRIGRAVARRSEVIGFETGYCARREVKNASYRFHASVEALSEWADVLVVAASAKPDTLSLISGAVLERLGPQGYLVNVARGSLIDEDALCATLARGGLAGAALDVLRTEPSKPTALIEAAAFAGVHLILTPHIGSATGATRGAMAEHVFRNVSAFFSNDRLENVVPGN